MNRTVFVMLFLLVTNLPALPQEPKPAVEVTDQQWQELLLAVSNENWDTAVDFSAKYLKQLKEGDERLPRLRYIYLYAAAGKVSEGGMSFDQLAESLKDFIGKEVNLPYRPITEHCRGALNFICSSEGTKDKLQVAATNRAGTTIHAFEYVLLKEPFDIGGHEGQQASLGGIIDSVIPNPNKSRFLVMRIYISKGFVMLREQAPKKASFIIGD